MYTVFQMAFEEYIRDLKDYYNQNPGIYDVSEKFYNSNVGSREEQDKKKNQAKTDVNDLTGMLEKIQKYDKKWFDYMW